MPELNRSGNFRGRNARHGESCRGSWSPEYRAWLGMRGRCLTPTNRKYQHYGGRGIRICERWASFEVFLADVGRRPSPRHSIDRIDVDGHYEPGNVRWATPSVQSANRRTSIFITVDGETHCLAHWAARVGIGEATIRARIKSGWAPQDAVSRPLRGSL